MLATILLAISLPLAVTNQGSGQSRGGEGFGPTLATATRSY